MKVIFRVNLGMVDAKTVGLKFDECKLGNTVEVPAEVGERLRKAGIVCTEEEAIKDAWIVSHREELARKAKEEAEATVKGEAKKPAITAPAKQ
jgi:hypothetical protein